MKNGYRGRLAPSPTGFLHLGHARTFGMAAARAREAGGRLFLRIEDIDQARCKREWEAGILEDLAWLGLTWEPPLVRQSERRALYLDAWRCLRDGGWIYPCICSRRDVLGSLAAPHEGADDEPLYPGRCRPAERIISRAEAPGGVHWRFRVPTGRAMEFSDRLQGCRKAVAGADFGDFVVWRKDDLPAYQLAVVVDDADMAITEVVRGADLLISTFRQLLLYEALGWTPPHFAHVDLVRDEDGRRLAKRSPAHEIRALRERGADPAGVI